MAQFGIEWDGLKELTDFSEQVSRVDERRIQEESVKAAHDLGQKVYDQIMAWLESGKPDWPRLSDVTVLLRGEHNEKNTPRAGEPIPTRGSSQPLIDHGDFKRAIQIENTDSGSSIGIIVPVGPKGQDMEMIAKIMEGGAVIPVTDKMRNYLSAKGIHLKKTTRVLMVPARPLIGPAADMLDEHLNEWLKPYEDALIKEFGLEDIMKNA